MTRGRLTPLLGLVGVALLFPFDATVTIVLGVLFLLAFVVCGVFAIATPEFLERDGE